MDTSDGVRVRGRLRLVLRDAATGRVQARREVGNLIVTSGIALLGQALNYALVLDENASWGSPYTPPVGAMCGVVGTSSTAVAAGQTALGAEIGRALVSNAAVAASTLGYDFFFPTSAAIGTIAEVGAVGAAAYLAPTLTAARNSGSTYTSLPVAGLTGTIPAGASLRLGYGTGTTQTVTTTSQAVAGDSSIAVSSFTASATFAAGAVAGYVPGTLIDRAVLAVPVAKSAAQTMTLSLTLTLSAA